MQLWIDVENASGIRLGDGPILTATGWQSTRRLDAAGTYSFSMPAADPRAALLAEKRIVRCWTADENGVFECGAGIIDQIIVEPQIDGPTMLTVSGDDLLRELVYRTVGDLQLSEEHGNAPTHLQISGDGFTSYDVTLPATINLEPGENAPANFLNIGYTEQFGALRFTLASPYNTTDATISIQYLPTGAGAGWTSVNGVVNGTVVGGRPFARSGTISFDIPSNWRLLTEGYVIRISCFPENLGAFRVQDLEITTIEPVADGLQRIMDLAPPGWSLDAAGAFATEGDVFLQYSGESDLAALVLLAAQTGEHFRLSVAGRRIEWLGSTQPSSGLRAIAAAVSSPGTMLLTAIRWTRDSYAMWNRIYAFGGGSGQARLTLAGTTRAVPAGYTLSTADSYLENTTAQGTFGRIDHRETFTDITPVDVSASSRTVAANALFDRAFEMLRRSSAPQHAYDLAVIPCAELILPGQTLRVSYHEWREQYHAVNIDADLVVLEVVQQIDVDGIHTAALTVATVDAWPLNDYRVVANALGEIQTDRAVKIPQSGLTSTGSGIPVAIGVENGQVTSLTRQAPILDGVYPRVGQGIDQLTLRNGLVVAINGLSA